MSKKIESKNAGVSLDDHVKTATETFYATVLSDCASAVVDYTNKCLSGELENKEETFREHLKLKQYVAPTGTKTATGRVVSALKGTSETSGRGSAKKKELTDAQEAMYNAINSGDWNYEWSANKCQRFVTAGARINMFCSAKPSSDSYFCAKCNVMTSLSKTIDRFLNEEVTPEEWYKEKVEACKKAAAERLGVDKGTSIKRGGAKATARDPPGSKAPASSGAVRKSSPVRTARVYKGVDQPEEGQWYWIRCPEVKEGGCVFDEQRNLIGTSKLYNSKSPLVQATKEEAAKFKKFAETLTINGVADAPAPAGARGGAATVS
jgi:hypothetical protein